MQNDEQIVPLDRYVSEAIRLLFPNAEIPDQGKNNTGPNGIKFKAPDFSIHESQLLIELKSQTISGNDKIDREVNNQLQEHNKNNEKKIHAIGMVPTSQVIGMLPNSKDAFFRIASRDNAQKIKSIKQSSEKFKSWKKVKDKNYTTVLINSDQRSVKTFPEIDIKYIKNRHDNYSEEFEGIDFIVLIYSPDHTPVKKYGSWFNILALESTLASKFEKFDCIANSIAFHIYNKFIVGSPEHIVLKQVRRFII